MPLFVPGFVPGQLPGTRTNDAAAAGNVGEIISATVLKAAEVALTHAVAANITSIVLTPGDWEVSGTILMDPAATTNISASVGCLSLVSATLDTTPGRQTDVVNIATGGNSFDPSIKVGPARFSVAVNTTVFLVVLAAFSVSTNAAFGELRARRVR